MNPGISDETGQTARSFIEVMKTQPALLGMVVANITMLVFIFYALHGAAQYRETLTTQVLTNASQIHTILSQRAIACPDVPRFNLQSDETKPAELPPPQK
jgi:hypothetical protein